MKFTIPGPLPDNIYNISRKLGYHFERVVKNTDGVNEAAFSRVMGASGYPKFHLFMVENNGILEFRLHLDQKKPTYSGSNAHAGEYSGKTVEDEAKRIQQILNSNI